MKKRFIYITTNKINNKKYIGRHTGYVDDNYLGLGIDLLKDIDMYGKENFSREIIEIVETNEELNIAEKKWINLLNANTDPLFYNLMEGGIGGNSLVNLSQEQLKERSLKIKQTISEFSPEKRKKYLKVKSISMKEVRSRKNDVEEQRVKNFKKTVSSKTVEEKNDQYKKISKENHYCARRVQTPSGIFEYASAAANVANISVQTVLNRCKNPKFKEWNFLDENS